MRNPCPRSRVLGTAETRGFAAAMCGILAALGVTGDAEVNRRRLLRCSRLLRHRGPDSSGVYEDPKGRAFISFERLNIVDPSDAGRYREQANDNAAAAEST